MSERASFPFSGYKQLPRLTDLLPPCGWATPDLRMTILAKDYSSERMPSDRYVIVFSMPITVGDGNRPAVYKHKLFEAEWNRNEWPCRLDTKAVARSFSMHLHRSAAFPSSPSIPATSSPRVPVGYEFLEDRVLRPMDWPSPESHVATESNEFRSVLRHLVASGLILGEKIDIPMNAACGSYLL
jgi:hypothetical protein